MRESFNIQEKSYRFMFLGHWVILQNIHLVAAWLPKLEKLLLQLRSSENSDPPHEQYRVFMSAEPPPAAEFHIIPQGLLEDSVKITNEPPTKIQANLHKALDNFSQVDHLKSTKQLCLFQFCVLLLKFF